MIKYEKNPKKNQSISNDFVSKNTELSDLGSIEKELTIQMLKASGDLAILDNIRISKEAVETAFEVFDDDYDLLCDTKMLTCGLKQKYLKDEPICLISKASVISQAKSNKLTRSMVAVDLWKPYLPESIVVIGSESTALFRLLEILAEMKEEKSKKKPALIIATPVGFSGAEKAKDYLWEKCGELGVPCVALLGTRGGADIASAVMNTLLKLHKERVKEDTD